MIFYFSGTGNSLYVARKIAENLGETSVYSMSKEAPTEQIADDDSGDSNVGFVFPSYYGNMPRIVKEFISKLDIHPDAYIYCIVTMGAFGEGSVATLVALLSDKGQSLQYGCGLRMPANYIVNYNPMFISRAKKVDKKIDRIAEEIKANKHKIKTNSFVADNLYEDIEQLDKMFFVESQCNECGLCEKVCPVANIALVDKNPQWQHRCEHCMACIHWCPKEAIQYGSKTKKRRRYHHPNVTVEDMICR